MKLSATVMLVALGMLGIHSAQAQNRLGGSPDGDVSLKLEIERGIDKGIKYLLSQQNAKTGAWGDEQLPAFTALAIASILNEPTRKDDAPLSQEVEKAYQFLLSQQKPDGGIYGKGLATYNTSLSIMALSLSGKEEHFLPISKARRLLINQQQDYDKRGTTDNLFDGGVGYGGSYAHSDLSNSHLAMEALHYSKKVLADTPFDESANFDLDWDAAIDFVSRCQNTAATAKQLGNITVRDEDQGGFVYFPGNTKAEEIELKHGKAVLRSYGSMTYAGLLAFIYAEMDPEDQRIQDALKWLQTNYTLDENPGLDAQGLYYYYHTMAKALTVARVNKITTAGGKQINWKKDLALKVLSNQTLDGSWTNKSSNRWMEDNPILVTAYSILSLAHIHRAL